MTDTHAEQVGRDAARTITDQVDLSITPSELTDVLMCTIANTIASIIDAGSERDAVMENTELQDVLAKEVDSWYTTSGEGWRPGRGHIQ